MNYFINYLAIIITIEIELSAVELMLDAFNVPESGPVTATHTHRTSPPPRNVTSDTVYTTPKIFIGILR